jgi:hypothetical protein
MGGGGLTKGRAAGAQGRGGAVAELACAAAASQSNCWAGGEAVAREKAAPSA